jgi:hypothetical protein
VFVNLVVSITVASWHVTFTVCRISVSALSKIYSIFLKINHEARVGRGVRDESRRRNALGQSLSDQGINRIVNGNLNDPCHDSEGEMRTVS